MPCAKTISLLACFKSNLLDDEMVVKFINDYASNQVRLVSRSPWLDKNDMLTKSSKDLENPKGARTPTNAWISNNKYDIDQCVILPKITTPLKVEPKSSSVLD